MYKDNLSNYNSMFVRYGIDSQIRDDEWFFAILEAMNTD